MKVPRKHFPEKVTCDPVVIQPSERVGRTQNICRNGDIWSNKDPQEVEGMPLRLWGLLRGLKDLGKDSGRELIFIEKTGLCVILRKAQAFGEAAAQILNYWLKRTAMNNRHRI